MNSDSLESEVEKNLFWNYVAHFTTELVLD